LRTFYRQQEAWARAHKDFLDVEATETSLSFAMRTDHKRMERMSITVGEVVYHLRSALDYVVWAIATSATGSPVKGTQFPIEDSPQTFEVRVTGKNAKGKPVRNGHFLKGVPPDCVKAIRALQPFSGCTWTKDLRELSNPDKHRHLSPLRGRIGFAITGMKPTDPDPVTGKKGTVIDYDAEMQLFFDDGRDVHDTLHALHGEVVATIASSRKASRSRRPHQLRGAAI
jgi:hypothetical protein